MRPQMKIFNSSSPSPCGASLCTAPSCPSTSDKHSEYSWELILYPHQHWFSWTAFPWVPDILQPSGISLKVPGVYCLWSTQPLLPCRSKFSLHEQNVKLFCLLSLQNTENLFQSSHKFKRRKLLYNLPLSSFPYSLDFCVLSLYPFFSISQE